MKPDPQAVLGYLTELLLSQVAPKAQPPYLAGTIGMVGTALAVLTEEWDRAASRLVEENRAIRALLRRAETLSLSAELARDLRALAGGDDEDLRLSALDAGNSELRGALIRLQTAIETRKDAAAEALNAAIWSELVASTERRRLTGAPF
jgi:capsule polysaccharide export protein KpsE/RkpR